MSSAFDLSSFRIEDFRKKLIAWFKVNKRNLPWRNSTDWYLVFLSEFLLQQTQVDQALPYFEKFINQYPDIYTLAKAPEHEILTLWAGLGYYSRARNMLKAARLICEEFNGHFPENFRDAISLPGVGDYTASAILSIAFNKVVPVVDGNVQRVITRVFAFPEDIRMNKTNQTIRDICESLIDQNEPGNFNEGMMELGAVICKPKNPICNNCPVNSECRAYASQSVDKFPYKSPPAPKKLWHHFVLVAFFGDKYLLMKRRSTGLLASFWEFPVLPVDSLDSELSEISNRANEIYGVSGDIRQSGKKMTHIYSHIKLQFLPVLIELDEQIYPELSEYLEFTWVNLKAFNEYPIHNAHKKVIEWVKDQKLNPREM